jgi:ATP-binding cassette subfamily B protein
MNNIYLQFLRHINTRYKRQFFILFFLFFIAGLLEAASISAVVPFVTALIAPENFFISPKVASLINHFFLGGIKNNLLLITAIFCSIIVLASIFRLIVLHLTSRLAFSAGADLMEKIYSKILHAPYAFHINESSSDLISAVTTKSNTMLYNLILPFLNIASAVIILMILITTLLFIDPYVTTVTFIIFLGIYIGVYKLVQKRLIKNSQIVSASSTRMIKILQESLGGIREIILGNTYSAYLAFYKQEIQLYATASSNNQVLFGSPRFLVESLVITLISIISCYLVSNHSNVIEVIAILGALALAGQRMVPVLQQIYGSWSSIKGGERSLVDILQLLDRDGFPNCHHVDLLQEVPFTKSIELRKITYSHGNDSQVIFNNLDLKIAKGSRVGFTGQTGVGKSTLLDIVNGLLELKSGHIVIDEKIIDSNNLRGWQSKIAHVPQVVYLADTSLLENIAFGVPRQSIDYSRVLAAAKQAQIYDFIKSLPSSFDTTAGERGVRLSGGQKQRIAIARALYRNVEVIIFDEATSALDEETENAVMEAIKYLSKELTILIVAHRLNTLKNCDVVINLKRSTSNECVQLEIAIPN